MATHIGKGLTPMERAQADSLARALLTLRSVDPKMSIEEAYVLLAVASRPGIPQREVGEGLELPSGPMSRLFGRLTIRGDATGEGLKLIRTEDSPTDFRLKLNFLSQQGDILARAVLREAFEAAQGEPRDASQTEG